MTAVTQDGQLQTIAPLLLIRAETNDTKLHDDQYVAVAEGSEFAFEGVVVARQRNGQDVATWRIKGTVDRQQAHDAVGVGITVSQIGATAGATGWTFAAAVAPDRLTFSYRTNAATPVLWLAKLERARVLTGCDCNCQCETVADGCSCDTEHQRIARTPAADICSTDVCNCDVDGCGRDGYSCNCDVNNGCAHDGYHSCNCDSNTGCGTDMGCSTDGCQCDRECLPEHVPCDTDTCACDLEIHSWNP